MTGSATFTLPAACCLTLLALPAAGCESSPDAPERVTVVLEGHEFVLDLAVDDPSRVRGLKGVAEIPEHGGMLFIFPGAQPRSFWMEGCLVDIDIIFADAVGRVTAMHRMKAEPPRRDDESQLQYERRLRHYSSVFPAQYAIELRAGWLDRLDLAVESKLGLDVDRLKTLPR